MEDVSLSCRNEERCRDGYLRRKLYDGMNQKKETDKHEAADMRVRRGINAWNGGAVEVVANLEGR